MAEGVKTLSPSVRAMLRLTAKMVSLGVIPQEQRESLDAWIVSSDGRLD